MVIFPSINYLTISTVLISKIVNTWWFQRCRQSTKLLLNCRKSSYNKETNSTQVGSFWGCSRMLRIERYLTLKFVTHILQWWNLAHLYLTYRITIKYINPMIHFLGSTNISLFLQEIREFYYNKKYRCNLNSEFGYKFDDVIKNGYYRSS